MNEMIKKYNTITAPIVFIAMPLLFWALGDVPRRTILKESISIITVIAFFLMLSQFYLTRGNGVAKTFKMSGIQRVHKIIGYVFTGVLLIHPFLILVTRYFEAGADPVDSFVTMLTTFNSPGIILGICAWCSIYLMRNGSCCKPICVSKI